MDPKGLYLFLGPDRESKRIRIEAIAKLFRIESLDRHEVDADSLPPAGIIALCRQNPLLSQTRLIVINDAHKLTSEAVEGLLEHSKGIAKVAYVILLVETSLNTRHPLSKKDSRFNTENFSARPSSANKPFALIDALGKKDVVAAMSALRAQLTIGKEPLGLLGLISWQLQHWVSAKRLNNRGCLCAEIEKILGLRAWQAERVLMQVSSRSLDSLRQLLTRCWQIEYDVKRGLALPIQALEGMVYEICLGEQDLVRG